VVGVVTTLTFLGRPKPAYLLVVSEDLSVSSAEANCSLSSVQTIAAELDRLIEGDAVFVAVGRLSGCM
jgi:hypothetical protein